MPGRFMVETTAKIYPASKVVRNFVESITDRVGIYGQRNSPT